MYNRGREPRLAQQRRAVPEELHRDGDPILSDGAERAMSIATPMLFTSDQGSQFTSTAFAGRLTDAGVLLNAR
ncbi:hypothetical protein CLG94_04860 [Candidatus Methylomirabilis limnetica]|uniref:Integrase catalytic domain-containing protein n=1 Tax=Candidatus Methylomirabilis limnetica TaxID=2033718 RepID=A0A2T4TZ23_9BACT|nr:hypothetical protein [Candidatus Methylomirabilis limnetica]PTL36366.1 hypothetical protein CLG94_04860 [Candidatus Methylomirabilis limnetica]